MKRISIADLTLVHVNSAVRKATIRGQTNNGGTFELEISLEHLSRLGQEALRGMRSHEARRSVGILGDKAANVVASVDLTKWSTGTSIASDGSVSVVMVLDQQTEAEIAYRMPPDTAADLGANLRESADLSKSPARGRRLN